MLLNTFCLRFCPHVLLFDYATRVFAFTASVFDLRVLALFFREVRGLEGGIDNEFPLVR
jgi:hypothetical protein